MAEFDLVSFLFGAAMKARERAEEDLDELIKKGEDWGREWKENVNMRALGKKEEDGNGEADGDAKKPVKKATEGIRDILRSIGVMTADDLKDLESRIDKVSAKLEKRNK